MIRSFADEEAQKLFETGGSRKFRAIEKVAKRKLDRIDAAEKLEDLLVPPGNRLEALKGDRGGCHSIRINVRFRICFRWSDGAEDVEIVDYH
ncbi:MAG: type II toxin-antitoxin system RelE/ParE family toxin [Bryobacteraceae bacterium]